jgi:hypothetical protein
MINVSRRRTRRTAQTGNATRIFGDVARSSGLQPGIFLELRAINPIRSSISGCNLSRKLAPDQRFSTFGYRNRAEGSMVRGGRKRHHMSVKEMDLSASANQAGTAVGTLAAKKGNLLSSANFLTIANRMYKKDIQNSRFGI